MREYQQRNTLKRIMYSKITIFVLALLCILMLRSVIELHGKYKKVAILQQESDKGYQVLVDKVRKSEDKNQALHTNRGIEGYVRRTYPVIKEGEGVIVVYDASTSPVVSVKKDDTTYQKVRQFFMDIFSFKNNS